jgi:CRP/FNR family transcriptional regulator
MQSASARQAVRDEPIFEAANTSTKYRWPVSTGKFLFEPGQKRRLYRIERGAVCHYVRPANGGHEVIEFAFPGEIIGLGHSAVHVSTARAMVDTEVSAITDAEFESALRNDSTLYFRLAEAGEREFDYYRNRSLKGDLLPPLERVANFILAIVSINESEGRDRMVVADDVSSGFVAEQLQMSIYTLVTVLLSLQRSGLVDVSAKGLRILDVSALEKLAAQA